MDTEILRTLSADRPPWIVVSHNAEMLSNKVERVAIAEAGLTVFYLREAWGYMPMHEQAWKFIKVWPRIIECALVKQPTVFEIPVKSLKPRVLGFAADFRS